MPLTRSKLALALAVPLVLSGCQEGGGEANGKVRLVVEGFNPNAQLTTEWKPEPEYFGMVRNSETGQTFGQVPVGSYSLTVSQSGKTGTATFEVVENKTTDVAVSLG